RPAPLEPRGAASGAPADEPLALQLDQPLVNLPAPGGTPCEGNQSRHGPLAVENQDDLSRLDMLEVPRQVGLQFGDASLPHVAIIAMSAHAGQWAEQPGLPAPSGRGGAFPPKRPSAWRALRATILVPADIRR